MTHRKFSLISFIIGIVAGLLFAALVVGGSFMHFYNVVRTGAWDDTPGIVRDIGSDIRANIEKEQSLAVYGAVTKVEENAIEIEADRLHRVETLRFRFDESTAVVYRNNDDESTEIPMRAVDLQLGENVTIITNEPIGSVTDQHAVKIVKI